MHGQTLDFIATNSLLNAIGSKANAKAIGHITRKGNTKQKWLLKKVWEYYFFSLWYLRFSERIPHRGLTFLKDMGKYEADDSD